MNDQREGKRAFYRIRYPAEARPSLWIGVRWFAVTELSEHGLRVLAGQQDLSIGQPIEAVVRLLHGVTRQVQARTDRFDEPELVLRNVRGISFADVLAEQRALVRDYPGLF